MARRSSPARNPRQAVCSGPGSSSMAESARSEKLLREPPEWPPQPGGNRNREPHLRPIDELVADQAPQHLPKNPFPTLFSNLVLAIQAPSEFDDTMVQQRHAGLEAHRQVAESILRGCRRADSPLVCQHQPVEERWRRRGRHDCVQRPIGIPRTADDRRGVASRSASKGTCRNRVDRQQREACRARRRRRCARARAPCAPPDVKRSHARGRSAPTPRLSRPNRRRNGLQPGPELSPRDTGRSRRRFRRRHHRKGDGYIAAGKPGNKVDWELGWVSQRLVEDLGKLGIMPSTRPVRPYSVCSVPGGSPRWGHVRFVELVLEADGKGLHRPRSSPA